VTENGFSYPSLPMASPLNNNLTDKLSRANTFWFTVFASVTAFCLYTCVFALRKTFTAATFDDLKFLGINYKVWLVTAQVIGYALAKFIGIKLISELKLTHRAKGILVMSAVAIVSWFFFAIVPAPFNIVFLFTNGLPLGMVWGMVFGYMEGRRVTEVLGAALSVSFIFSGGFGPSVGRYMMTDWNVPELWMPFTASIVFLIPLLIFLFLLDQIPPPSPLDEQLRTKRKPMNAEERKLFVTTFLPGIILFVLAYVMLTTFRELRQNFAADVWKTLGYDSSAIFTKTETPVTITVLIVIGSLMAIKNNKTALMINHIIVLIGMLMIGGATILFQQQVISPPLWMILIGTGLYLGYVPFNSVFFDRLLATFRFAGTVGFIMYVADSFGYLGSVAVLFFKEFSYAKVSWLDFFVSSGYFVSITGSVLIVASMIYFNFKEKTTRAIRESR
jgi:MFS family permease